MKVSVKLFAGLIKKVSKVILAQHPQGIRTGTSLEVELPEGSTLDDLVDFLALPREELKVFFVNGRARQIHHHLQDGDQVGIFPPVGGG